MSNGCFLSFGVDAKVVDFLLVFSTLWLDLALDSFDFGFDLVLVVPNVGGVGRPGADGVTMEVSMVGDRGFSQRKERSRWMRRRRASFVNFLQWLQESG